MAIQKDLLDLIQSSSFLTKGDKDFIIQKASYFSPIEILKLKHSLKNGVAPTILGQLKALREKFVESETPKEPDIITKAVQKVFKPAPPKIVSGSYLNQSHLLGSPVPQLKKGENAPDLADLQSITSLAQLKHLHPNHITFSMQENGEVVLQDFFEKVETLFDKHWDINHRREKFIPFITSPLFKSYIDTGLTALRHPELQPLSIILNTLYQIDNKYLNRKQFKYAALICNRLRSLVGI